MAIVRKCFRLVLIWLPALITSACLLVVATQFESHHKEPRLFIKLFDASEGEIKVYWDMGSGFSEAFSEAKPTGRYTHQLLVWTIPDGVIAFRVDETVNADALLLDALRIGRFERMGSRLLDPADFKHFYEVEAEVTDQHLLLRFHEGADDPYFVGFDIQEHIAAAERAVSHWFFILVGVSLLPLLAQVGLSVGRALK